MFSEGNGYVRWPCMHEDEWEKETQGSEWKKWMREILKGMGLKGI